MISSRGTVSCSPVKSSASARVRSRASRKLLIVSPAPINSTLGNSITASRYARIFRSLGWRVEIAGAYENQPADCIVGLHAKKSARSLLTYRERYPNRPVILVLTGTDLYRDIAASALAVRALEVADRLVTLQPDGIRQLPKRLRAKATAVIQSAAPCKRTRRPHGKRPFVVCVLGHLRHEKDPMRAAYAVRRFDPDLDVRVVHAGRPLTPQYERLARDEMQRNARYTYLGALDRAAARETLARSDVLVQSSRMEGGANAVCEAIACGVPVIGSRISGNTGILGRKYPGLYAAGDTRALRALLERAARSAEFYDRLQRATEDLLPLVAPERERALWNAILSQER